MGTYDYFVMAQAYCFQEYWFLLRYLETDGQKKDDFREDFFSGKGIKFLWGINTKFLYIAGWYTMLRRGSLIWMRYGRYNIQY